jgi:hypothetical protein
VPVMDPTAHLVADYLEHRGRHPGLGADADPLFPRTEPLQTDSVRGREAADPPRAGRPLARPRMGSRPAGRAPHAPADTGHASDRRRGQPDLHP